MRRFATGKLREGCLIELEQRFVRMGERQQRIVRGGIGSPLIIFESGCGGSSSDWSRVATRIGEETAFLAYDRFGCGASDAGEKPRTAMKLAQELDCLLAELRESRPIVLVGLSFGALVARAFAQRNLSRVTGVVLVEPAHEELLERMPASLVADEKRQWAVAPRSVRDEVEAIEESSRELKQSNRNLGELPLAVITATKKWRDIRDESSRRAVAEIWLQLHEELASLSTNSRHIITDRCGHNVNVDAPEVIVDAIRAVLAESLVSR
jgi:pimeloyl-ACP methyl ester carboxylesterase